MKKAQAIMLQGTASDAGKSVIAAGFCRLFKDQGLKVVPFKSQNMALNSYITATGDEMGRAQVFQAEAAGIAPDVRMNPILLKPSTDQQSQVILLGKVLKDMTVLEYHDYKLTLLPEIKKVYEQLGIENERIVIEGAGSPAEINLNDRDIVNMGMARLVDAPVILVADIDKGGVFASIYGTLELMDPEDKKRVIGVIINKFRGDKKLLEPGLKMIEELTGVPVIGVLPYLDLDIDEEDSVVLSTKQTYYDESKALDIAVISLKRMSNFTDMRSLEQQPDVSLRYVKKLSDLKQPDLIIIPGTKNTIEDAEYLKKNGFDEAIRTCYERGTNIFGICGGYQLLGDVLIENDTQVKGLGLLPLVTNFMSEKITTQVEAKVGKYNVKGYEIHMGETLDKSSKLNDFSKIYQVNGEESERLDGVITNDGSIIGTYLHGIFDNVEWARAYLNNIRVSKGMEKIVGNLESLEEQKEREYAKLAEAMRDNIDLDFIYSEMIKFGRDV
ncbi:cobyric acid synthase [Vagococcus fessus]|uniref:Cobyric acid synthase n=1 Tax=Vagococcus fessus TaxID=120370 RepID=A0A430ACZ4_9ENTE|nr:cobyric acid synthase [Vagococcus fessus]RSU05091.1 cobyric acid synthase CobQ [Vagococcus fessus]